VPNAWIYVDIRGVDVGTYVQMAMHAVNEAMPRAQSNCRRATTFSGAASTNNAARPATPDDCRAADAAHHSAHHLSEHPFARQTAIVMLAVPFSLVGAFWIIYLLHYNLSVAVWVGIIALAGLDAETGVVMLLYLDLAYDEWKKKGLMRQASICGTPFITVPSSVSGRRR